MGFASRNCLRTALIAAALLCSVLSLQTGSSRADSWKPYEYSLDRMGTIFRIVLYAPDDARALGAAMAAFERIEDLEQVLSDYREDSEVNRLCRNGSAGPVVVSRDLFSAIEQSLRISRLTGGAFDVTIGPVTRVWRQARKARRVPVEAELRKAREAVGHEKVMVDVMTRAVRLERPDMRFDFGGIGKGIAADEVLAVLNSRGIRSAMIDGGGDLRLGEPPPGKGGWKIAVRDTESAGRSGTGYLLLHDVGVATSGDTFQFTQATDRRYSHIVDPATGMGLTDSATVTVIARDGATADALATAASVLSAQEALRIVDTVEGASAAVVSGSKRVVSSRFPKLQRDDLGGSGRQNDRHR